MATAAMKIEVFIYFAPKFLKKSNFVFEGFHILIYINSTAEGLHRNEMQKFRKLQIPNGGIHTQKLTLISHNKKRRPKTTYATTF